MKYNILLFIFCLLAASAAFAEPPTITVVGEAREEVAPDQAVLSGQLISKAKKLSIAKEENDGLAKRVASVAAAFDIPKEKIAASNVYIAPEYVWNQGENKQDQVGYIVSRNLSITMDNMEIHERLLSALLDKGIDQINGVQFNIADPESHQDKLRVKALENAHKRAQILAEAAGAKLGKVISINTEAVEHSPMPVPRGVAMMAKSEGLSTAPSLPGTVSLQQNIYVVYELKSN